MTDRTIWKYEKKIVGILLNEEIELFVLISSSGESGRGLTVLTRKFVRVGYGHMLLPIE